MRSTGRSADRTSSRTRRGVKLLAWAAIIGLIWYRFQERGSGSFVHPVVEPAVATAAAVRLSRAFELSSSPPQQFEDLAAGQVIAGAPRSVSASASAAEAIPAIPPTATFSRNNLHAFASAAAEPPRTRAAAEASVTNRRTQPTPLNKTRGCDKSIECDGYAHFGSAEALARVALPDIAGDFPPPREPPAAYPSDRFKGLYRCDVDTGCPTYSAAFLATRAHLLGREIK